MYNGGEAADQMVSYAFKGSEVVLRMSGSAAKHLAIYLTALLKQGGPSKGKTTLKRMIADGKELTVQRIDADQIPYFNAMAKKYGVMFVAVKDKQNPDGKCDIMFRLEDSARVSRIFDRLAISDHPDVAHIKSEIIRSREEKKNPQKARSRSDKSPSPSARTSPIRSATGAAKPSVRKALQAIRNARRAVPAKTPKTKQKSR